MNQTGVTPVARGTGLRRGHLVIGAIVLLILLLVGVSLAYLSPVLALLDSHPSALPRGVPAPATAPPPLDSSKRINVLLLGSDNDQKFQATALLSQTMIVVSIDPAHHDVTLLSLPRDLWVDIPGRSSAKIDLAAGASHRREDLQGSDSLLRLDRPQRPGAGRRSPRRHQCRRPAPRAR